MSAATAAAAATYQIYNGLVSQSLKMTSVNKVLLHFLLAATSYLSAVIIGNSCLNVILKCCCPGSMFC